MNTTDNKKDWLDRKIEGVTNALQVFFGMVQKNARDFILTISIVANVYLGHKIIDNVERMNERIVEEVRKRVPEEVKKETKSQLGGIADTLKNTAQEVKDKLLNLDKTNDR